MTVCLTVLSIIGTYCVENARPVGQCVPRLSEVVDCVVPAERLPVRASFYNPAWGGINCDSDCAHTGDGTPVADCYEVCLACPVGWYGRWLDFGPWVGEWQCRDHGGAIQPHYGLTYTPEGFAECWWITVDFMAHDEPDWAYLLLPWEGS
jgi:hypothetical protein